MNNSVIDYSKYHITSTSQFDDGLIELKSKGHTKELEKLFRVIDEILLGMDMNALEYSRPLENSDKMYHIHLDGRQTGNIILIYRTDGRNLDLDLKLYNISDPKNLSRKGSKKFTKHQQLSDFDVIANKYSEYQIEFVNDIYTDLISNYEFYKKSGEDRKKYSEQQLQLYYELYDGDEPLSYDDFMSIVHYIDSKRKKSIFGSSSFSDPQRTYPITAREERFIIELVQDYNVEIQDAYIETEVDEFGDTYESMFVSVISDDYSIIKLLESDFYALESMFGILFESEFNGFGRCGKTYEFYHYFE